MNHDLTDEELAHYQALIIEHTKRLRVLEIQAAQFGLHTPPYIHIELEAVREQIQLLQQAFERAQAQKQQAKLLDDKSNAPIRVLIADDQRLFALGIAALLTAAKFTEVSGVVNNGRETIEFVETTPVDIILMDINMPYVDGLSATKEILFKYPNIRVIMLTVSMDDDDIFSAMKAGASGYLLKNLEPHVLYDALRLVYQGSTIFGGDIATRMIDFFSEIQHSKEEALFPQLDDQEFEILRHITTGANDREIAQALLINEQEVKLKTAVILHKLHLTDRIQHRLAEVSETT
jgi:DNA-binding NarL/FixJ family response regulator